MYVSDMEIERIVFKTLGYCVDVISRFQDSKSGYIYDVKTDKKNLILKFSSEDRVEYLAGYQYWTERLLQAGVKMPNVLYVNTSLEEFKYYFVIVEKVAGCNIAPLYPDLTASEKRDIASEIVSLQNIVAKTTKSKFPGNKFMPTDKLDNKDWYVYFVDITDIAEKLEDKSLFDFGKIYEFEFLAYKYKDVLKQVEIKAYIDNITTENVIVNKGKFNGIINTEYVSYGDPLMALALTKLKLLKLGYDLDYLYFWSYEMSLTKQQESLLNLYALKLCLVDMSELGENSFYGTKIKYKKEIHKLISIFEMLKNDIA